MRAAYFLPIFGKVNEGDKINKPLDQFLINIAGEQSFFGNWQASNRRAVQKNVFFCNFKPKRSLIQTKKNIMAL